MKRGEAHKHIGLCGLDLSVLAPEGRSPQNLWWGTSQRISNFLPSLFPKSHHRLSIISHVLAIFEKEERKNRTTI